MKSEHRFLCSIHRSGTSSIEGVIWRDEVCRQSSSWSSVASAHTEKYETEDAVLLTWVTALVDVHYWAVGLLLMMVQHRWSTWMGIAVLGARKLTLACGTARERRSYTGQGIGCDHGIRPARWRKLDRGGWDRLDERVDKSNILIQLRSSFNLVLWLMPPHSQYHYFFW